MTKTQICKVKNVCISSTIHYVWLINRQYYNAVTTAVCEKLLYKRPYDYVAMTWFTLYIATLFNCFYVINHVMY